MQENFYDNYEFIAKIELSLQRIRYNLLDLPAEVRFQNGGKTEYRYSAAGEKLSTTHYIAMVDIIHPEAGELEHNGDNANGNDTNQYDINPINQYDENMNETNWALGARDGLPASATPADTLWVQQAQTDYLGGVTLEAMGGGPARLRLQVAGGFVTIEPAQRPRYHYYVSDHLGSVRLVVDEYGEVEQYNDFYAYGSQTSHGRGAGLQSYKFTGKELETTHGQCLYDFGARWLDPLLPRWTSTDPLAEAYYHVSPYAYCAGNPVSFVDPDGMGINDVNELEGATIVGERKKRYVMDKSWYEWKKNNQREQKQTSKISDDNEPGGSGPVDWKDAFEKAKKALSEIGTFSSGYGATKHYKHGDYREWTDSKGRKRTSKELEKQANGKYKKGVQGIRNSEKFAREAAAPFKNAGYLLGIIAVGLDGFILYKDPSWENAGKLAISGASAVWSEVGLLVLFGEIRMRQHERAAERFRHARDQQY